MRKYALTSTIYKFLNIGIVIESISHVQITIGDIKAIAYSYLMWKAFIERREDIERLMQSTVSSSIQNLNVELVKIYE